MEEGRMLLDRLCAEMGIDQSKRDIGDASRSRVASATQAAESLAAKDIETASNSSSHSTKSRNKPSPPSHLTSLIQKEALKRFHHHKKLTLIILEASDLIINCNSKTIPPRDRRREALDAVWKLVTSSSECEGLVSVITTIPFSWQDHSEGLLELGAGDWVATEIQNESEMKQKENLRILSLRGLRGGGQNSSTDDGENKLRAWSIQFVPRVKAPTPTQSHTSTEVELDMEVPNTLEHVTVTRKT
jgi:hypothetical protein